MGAYLQRTRRQAREKKRERIRRHLLQMGANGAFRQEVSDLIRAIRYVRLRNDEIAMLELLVRLRRCIMYSRKRSGEESSVLDCDDTVENRD